MILRCIDLDEFLRLELPPRENILDPCLPRQGLLEIHGWRGTGKTHVVHGMGWAVVCGGAFLRWKAPEPRSVLLLDGELPAGVLKERLSQIALRSELKPQAHFRILTPDLQPSGMIDLSRPEDQEALEPHLRGIDLVIVDNISSLCRTGRENEAESWLPVQQWALCQRAAGRSVIFVHHSGKGGAQRGTSRREDVLDTVIALRLPKDYRPEQGARFEVHFEKARGIYGGDVKPFEARLAADGDRQTWTVRTIEESLTEQIAEALNDGIPQAEIPGLLGVTKGTVSKHRKKAVQLGLLD